MLLTIAIISLIFYILSFVSESGPSTRVGIIMILSWWQINLPTAIIFLIIVAILLFIKTIINIK